MKQLHLHRDTFAGVQRVHLCVVVVAPRPRLYGAVKFNWRNLSLNGSFSRHLICSKSGLSFNVRSTPIDISEGLHVPNLGSLLDRESLWRLPPILDRLSEIRLNNTLKEVKYFKIGLMLCINGVLDPLLLVHGLISQSESLVFQHLRHTKEMSLVRINVFKTHLF
jgi:hypothetical protein